jgi:hypothetical protein
MKKHYRHENDCLNCGAELKGHFCHECGQENTHLKEPFWHFLSHSISHYFHFDSKFFSTLKPLLTQPGYLTQQYMAGKRTRYLQPVSMYIFVSIVYFLVVPHLNHNTPEKREIGPVTITNDDNDSVSVKTLSPDSLAAAKKALKNVPFGDKYQEKIQKALTLAAEKNNEKVKIFKFKKLPFARQTLIIDSLTAVNKAHQTDSIDDRLDDFNEIHTTREDSTYDSYLKRQKRLPSNEQDNFFKKWSKQRDIEIKQKTNKDWDIDKEIEHYQPKLYFILMPLFAFCLMLNFRRNHQYYVEHIIFTIHFFTAFFIFEIIVKPIDFFIFHNGSKIIKLLTFAAICWYSYLALRTFYKRPPGQTIRKMVTLGLMYLMAFGISYFVIYLVVYLTA